MVNLSYYFTVLLGWLQTCGEGWEQRLKEDVDGGDTGQFSKGLLIHVGRVGLFRQLKRN